MSKKKKKIFLFSFVFRVILIVCASALVLSYLSRYINPAKFWFPSFFGLYFIPIAIINLLLLVLAIFRKSSSAWIPGIALLPSILFLDFFVAIGDKATNTSSEDGSDFKIITYNVGRFSADKKEATNEVTLNNIQNFIKKEKADIVCFQEFSISDTSLIKDLFPDYTYHSSHFFRLRNNSFFGNLTISHYPIIASGNISFKGSTNLAIFSDIDLSGKRVRIYNNHLESYNVTKELLEVHDKMRGTNSKRAHQVDVIMNNIRESDYLSVVCGDFNDTPMSFTYHKLSEERKDAFLESGKGFSATYSLFWPLLRIDYILIPESFDSKEYNTHRINYSDHYPISTILTF